MEDRYLFKAKRISDGEWVVGYIIRYGHTGKEKYYIVPSYASDLYSFLIDENTICQCTGLKDKNGKLIWENDIMVAHLDEDYPEDETYIKIIWHGNGFYVMERGGKDITLISKSDQEYFEVCGNIFDNPELLGRNGE